jgi:hypothetical protein
MYRSTARVLRTLLSQTNALFSIVLLLVVLAGSRSAAAATWHTGGETAGSPGAVCTAAYKTAKAAGWNYVLDGIKPDRGGKYVCGWHWEGDAKFTLGSGEVWMECPGALVARNGMCVDDTGDGSSCSKTGKPIDTQLGNKLFQDEDFATSDGGLVFDRYYQSIPHVAARGIYLDQPLGLANWRFGFQYEIHIPLVDPVP